MKKSYVIYVIYSFDRSATFQLFQTYNGLNLNVRFDQRTPITYAKSEIVICQFKSINSKAFVLTESFFKSTWETG